MRKIVIILLSAFIMNSGCHKNNSIVEKDEASASDMERIGSMGFSKEGILKLPDGFIVEGDLFISNDHLLQPENYAIQSLNSNEEHYRHVN
ncbi:hydantoinase B/oxoprolinase family protein, partial [Gynurincola endophyticus]|uniref:hydantoinase B/oxoprolinase family protein n=1 Tax=Gynurincola endophyticus TaxID=2479004 RepID=UPI0011D0F427